MFDEPQTRETLKMVAQAQASLPEAEADAFAFHMTDWLTDLDLLIKLYKNLGVSSADEAMDVLAGFLLHAPNHLAAASKLLTGVPVTDVFNVGATGDSAT
jgi:hypothetical protein